MAQSAYNIHITNKLAQIAKRFPNLTVPDSQGQHGPIVPYKNTFPQRVSLDNNIGANNGPSAIIDVQPDYRNIILFLNYYITKDYPEIQFKGNPYLTPPSLMGYFLALVYIQALLNDDKNVRTVKSEYAREFSTTKGLDTILTTLRKLPVPEFMIELIASLYHGSDERKPELKFVYSLACFDLNIDMFRAFPITMFFVAHNIIASRPANSQPDTLISEWLQIQLLSHPVAIQVAHLLGARHPQAEYENWFAHTNYSLFNPVTMRSNTVRPTLSRMRLHPQNLGEDASNINPYIYLLGMTPNNQDSVSKILTSIGKGVSNNYSKCVPLGQIEQDAKGNQILNHYYQSVLLPTSHLYPPRTYQPTDTIQPVTSEQYATATQFKHDTKVIPILPIVLPPVGTFTKQMFLGHAKKYLPKKDVIKNSLFKDPFSVLNDIRHLCPFETSSSNIYMNLITGKLIEHEELDSVSVPQPNPSHDTETENSYFLESAIPFTHIKPIILAPNAPMRIISRTIHDAYSPNVRIDFINRSEDRLALLGPHVDEPVPAAFVGFTICDNICEPQFGCNSLCYTIADETTPTEINAGIRKVLLWSSYRHLNLKQSTSVNIRNRKLMLSNLWTLFGTNATLVETSHPYLCIPSAD